MSQWTQQSVASCTRMQAWDHMYIVCILYEMLSHEIKISCGFRGTCVMHLSIHIVDNMHIAQTSVILNIFYASYHSQLVLWLVGVCEY